MRRLPEQSDGDQSHDRRDGKRTQWSTADAVAATVVVFTSYRIEMLRREAADARKLGQYVLKERLGAGGMGEVFLAEHTLLRRPCAVKLIRPERAADPDELRRFEREVRLTATLSHSNTIQVFDYGHTEDHVFYYVTRGSRSGRAPVPGQGPG